MISPEKRQLIKAFIDNKAMFEAVQEVMLSSITGSSLESLIIADAELLIDDATYGQMVRAKATAVGYTRRGFAQLERIANDKQGVQSQQNEAR